jgi:hypothetical protein
LINYIKELFDLAKSEPEKLLDPVMGSSLAELIVSDILPSFLDVLTNTPSLNLPEKESRYRRLVKDTARGVTEIATRFGFWHMGQFSADYKRMYGETLK